MKKIIPLALALLAILLVSGCLTQPETKECDAECAVNRVRELGIPCSQNCLMEMREPIAEMTFKLPLELRETKYNRMVTDTDCKDEFHRRMIGKGNPYNIGTENAELGELGEFCYIEWVSLEDEVGCKCLYSKYHYEDA